MIDSVEDRLLYLENIVIKKGEKVPIFEEIRDSINKIEVNRLMDKQRLCDRIDMIDKEIKNTKETEGFMQKQIDNLIDDSNRLFKQTLQITANISKQRDELLNKLSDTETNIRNHVLRLESSLEGIFALQTKYFPMVDMHESKIKKLEGLEEVCEKQINQLIEQTSLLEKNKLEIQQHQEDAMTIWESITKLNHSTEMYKIHFNRVENFIDKYQPVKIQNQISKSILSMFSKRDAKMARYREFETNFFRNQNEVIFADNGNPDILSQMKEIYVKVQMDPFYLEAQKEVEKQKRQQAQDQRKQSRKINFNPRNSIQVTHKLSHQSLSFKDALPLSEMMMNESNNDNEKLQKFMEGNIDDQLSFDFPTPKVSFPKSRQVEEVKEDVNNEEEYTLSPSKPQQNKTQTNFANSNGFLKKLTRQVTKVTVLSKQQSNNAFDDFGLEMSDLENIIDDKVNGLFESFENRMKGNSEQFEQRIEKNIKDFQDGIKVQHKQLEEYITLVQFELQQFITKKEASLLQPQILLQNALNEIEGKFQTLFQILSYIYAFNDVNIHAKDAVINELETLKSKMQDLSVVNESSLPILSFSTQALNRSQQLSQIQPSHKNQASGDSGQLFRPNSQQRLNRNIGSKNVLKNDLLSQLSSPNDKIVQYKGMNMKLKEMRQIQKDYQSNCYKLFTNSNIKYLRETFMSLVQRDLSTFQKNMMAQKFRRSKLQNETQLSSQNIIDGSQDQNILNSTVALPKSMLQRNGQMSQQVSPRTRMDLNLINEINEIKAFDSNSGSPLSQNAQFVSNSNIFTKKKTNRKTLQAIASSSSSAKKQPNKNISFGLQHKLEKLAKITEQLQESTIMDKLLQKTQ
eukprot:403369325